MNEPVLSLRDAIICAVVGLVLSIVVHSICDSDLPDKISSALRNVACETAIEDTEPDSSAICQLIECVDRGEWPGDYTIEDILALLEEAKKDQLKKLGVTKAVGFRLDHLPGNIAGQYAPAEEEIIIDVEALIKSSPKMALHMICHECYHVAQLQFAVIYRDLSSDDKDLWFFRDAKKYLDEAEDYVNCNEDLETYRSQQLEKDAENYAYGMVDTYFLHYKYGPKNNGEKKYSLRYISGGCSAREGRRDQG